MFKLIILFILEFILGKCTYAVCPSSDVINLKKLFPITPYFNECLRYDIYNFSYDKLKFQSVSISASLILIINLNVRKKEMYLVDVYR